MSTACTAYFFHATRQSEAVRPRATATGKSHHAAMLLRASTAVKASAITTPAAIVQSSPTMKSYQNLKNPIIYFIA